MIETAIVILHYNNNVRTNWCIDAIRANTKEWTYSIVVVDNDSPDEPFSRCDMADIHVIKNDNNGSVSGMNFGFQYALEHIPEAKYVVNFDNDVFPLEGWLEPLIKKMESDPKIGIVGGKQWDQERKNFRSVGMDMMGILYKNYPQCDLDVIWLTGSAVMFRADMMRKIGLHDSRYKSICSDCDYCIHALDRGYKVIFVADSNVVHLLSASYGHVYPEMDEDRRKFVQKWFGLKFSALSRKFPLSLYEKKSAYSELKVINNIKMQGAEA